MGHCTSVNNKKAGGQLNQKIIKVSLPPHKLKGAPAPLPIISDLNISITELPSGKTSTYSIKSNRSFYDFYQLLNINPNIEVTFQILPDNNNNNMNTIQIENVELSKTLHQILSPYFPKGYPSPLNLNIIKEGLDIPLEVRQAYINMTPVLASAIFDNPEIFGIVTYDRKSKEMKPFFYESKKLENLIKFNSFTAFCNAKGFLYISGGETEITHQDIEKSSTKYNDFFCIDINNLRQVEKLKENQSLNNNCCYYNNTFNNNENTNCNNLNNLSNSNYYYDNSSSDITNLNNNIKELPSLSEPRTWHSMILVPNKYIFIVGGSTKSVEVFDIEKNQLWKDSELNELRNESTLCLVNDIYLYAFCGFLLHHTFITSIEKCNLRKKIRKWEYVSVKMSEGLRFSPSFFAVSYYKNDQVLLIGANDSPEENNRSYCLKINSNNISIKNENNDGIDNRDEMSEFDCKENTLGVFRDKLFTPMENDIGVNIPMVFGDNIQLLKINFNTGFIEQTIYQDCL